MKNQVKQSGSKPQDATENHLLATGAIACVRPVRLYREIQPVETDNEFWSKYPLSYRPVPLKKRVIRKVVQILTTIATFIVGVSIVVFLAQWTGCHQISAVGGLVVGVLMLVTYLSFES